MMVPSCTERDGRVVVEAGGAALKERGDDDDAQLAGEFAEACCRGSGNRLGQIEEPDVFALAEVLSAKKLRQADDVGTALGRLANVAMADSRFASGSGPMLIWTRPTLYLRVFSMFESNFLRQIRRVFLTDKANPGVAGLA